MALPQRATDLSSAASPSDVQRTRRRTFRRLSRNSSGAEKSYEVSCLYPNRSMPLPIGDLDTSLDLCATCTAGNILRSDED